VISSDHDWVPNAISDYGGNVCRECGLVSEAYYEGSSCNPSATFQGIPGFPRKRPGMSEPVIQLKYLKPEQYSSWCKKVDDPEWTEHRYRDAKDKAMANAIRELRAAEAALSEAQRSMLKYEQNRLQDIDSLSEQVTQQAATIGLMDRLLKNKYMSWHLAGGPNECSHGFAEGIACRQCDLAALANVHTGEPTIES
jgi:hypothetical protein